jgi:hypothetical protein
MAAARSRVIVALRASRWAMNATIVVLVVWWVL